MKRIIRKILGRLNGIGYNSFRDKAIKVRDYGRTYRQIDGKIKGNGYLLVNSNAINSKEYSKIRIDKGAILNISGSVSLMVRTNIHLCEGATLSIGNGTYINEGTKIACKHKIIIGTECAISNDVSIMDSDFHRINGNVIGETGVVIGNHCWVGADVSILKNVRIGNDCVIGARTLVNRDIPDNCMVVGNPMRIVKTNINWE